MAASICRSLMPELPQTIYEYSEATVSLTIRGLAP